MCVCVFCAVVTERRSKLYLLKMLPFSSTACDSSTELFNCAEKPDPLQSLWESQEGPQWNGSSNDLMQLQQMNDSVFGAVVAQSVIVNV